MAENEPIVVPVGTDENEPQGVARPALSDIAVRRPRKVHGGMWGVPEIVCTAVGALALVLAILVYAVFVVPSNRELASNQIESQRLTAEMDSANSKYGQITNTQTQVGKLLTSVDDFETRYLPPSANGRDALYQRLNGLILSYGLVNTAGPDYAPLATADQQQQQQSNNQSDEERGRERFRSLFPGIYVTMTVEGPYQNLRRFIREIETGDEFVVISSIELEPSDTQQKKPENGEQPAGPQTTSARPAANTAGIPGITNGGRNVPGTVQPQTIVEPRPGGKTRGEVVALRLEMAAYFRRENYSPLTAPRSTNQ